MANLLLRLVLLAGLVMSAIALTPSPLLRAQIRTATRPTAPPTRVVTPTKTAAPSKVPSRAPTATATTTRTPSKTAGPWFYQRLAGQATRSVFNYLDGSCGYELSPAAYVAALTSDLFQQSLACGMCASVKGPDGEVVVRFVDSCDGCAYGDLNLNAAAFTQIAKTGSDAEMQGRVAITWRPVACPITKVSFRFKESSNSYWVAVQVINGALPVIGLECYTDWPANDGNYRFVAGSRATWNYFVFGSGLGPGPFTLRLTLTDSTANFFAIVDGVDLSPGDIITPP